MWSRRAKRWTPPPLDPIHSGLGIYEEKEPVIDVTQMPHLPFPGGGEVVDEVSDPVSIPAQDGWAANLRTNVVNVFQSVFWNNAHANGDSVGASFTATPIRHHRGPSTYTVACGGPLSLRNSIHSKPPTRRNSFSAPDPAMDYAKGADPQDLADRLTQAMYGASEDATQSAIDLEKPAPAFIKTRDRTWGPAGSLSRESSVYSTTSHAANASQEPTFPAFELPEIPTVSRSNTDSSFLRAVQGKGPYRSKSKRVARVRGPRPSMLRRTTSKSDSGCSTSSMDSNITQSTSPRILSEGEQYAQRILRERRRRVTAAKLQNVKHSLRRPTARPSSKRKLIQQAYAPGGHLSSEQQRQIQQELFDIQKRPEAWGLVLPFLSHSDPSVQFFGAHTVQVKIARDWSYFPQEHAPQLRDLLVNLTGQAMSAGTSKVTVRKLFVALTSLALKLGSQSSSQWPDWLSSTVQTLSGMGASAENLLDFCTIAAQEVGSADLLSSERAKIRQTLTDAVPMVITAISTCITRHSSPQELRSALQCLQAWMYVLPANDITPLIPPLLGIISPPSGQNEFNEDEFELVVEAFDDIMSDSALADGVGSKTLTEPLLIWCERYGSVIAERTMNEGFADSVSHSLCKLLAALGDHSSEYLASNLTSSALPEPVLPFQLLPTLPLKSHLVLTFLRLMLAYTGIPGYWGVDEEESDMTLGFWYLFQEALWSFDADAGEGGEDDEPSQERLQGEQANVAKAVYSELVRSLRRKVMWPERAALSRWTRDQRDKFQAYRRDVGDTLVNAYYVLRDDMLSFYVNNLAERLASKREGQPWEEVEATLHCIMAVQEAVPIEDNPHLRRLFGPEVLGKLPTTGNDRVRRTAIILLGTYASWFTCQPAPVSATQSILMSAISYVVSALPEPELCLPAANSLRELCDANRTALAPHVAAFGELHAGLERIPDTEKGKILQSIASVIQALPPAEEIAPIEAIVNPVVSKLYEALQSSSNVSHCPLQHVSHS
ncbi:hypothetical protein NM688_g8430 [Phlebia brevispora]|uniref:Uncharacterized protein n=1 Tax=Phlebia brevispora TaxID=194682 RepID=A0ACC1RSN9_9APHY|nr:hypothetical protein NM688_g8430 [Phlebia brevispora]